GFELLTGAGARNCSRSEGERRSKWKLTMNIEFMHSARADAMASSKPREFSPPYRLAHHLNFKERQIAGPRNISSSPLWLRALSAPLRAWRKVLTFFLYLCVSPRRACLPRKQTAGVLANLDCGRS